MHIPLHYPDEGADRAPSSAVPARTAGLGAEPAIMRR